MQKVLKTRANGVAREDIVAAATKLFADRGFSGVTLREIAAKAKVHVPAIYHDFDDKRALYVTCAINAFSTPSLRLAQILNDEMGDEEHLFVFMTGMCRLNFTEPVLVKLVQRQVLDDDRMLLDLLNSYAIGSYIEPLVKILSRVTTGRDVRQIAFSMLALSYGAAQLKGFRSATGWSTTAFSSPEELARFVLGVILPEIDWTPFAAAPRRKAGRPKGKAADGSAGIPAEPPARSRAAARRAAL